MDGKIIYINEAFDRWGGRVEMSAEDAKKIISNTPPRTPKTMSEELSVSQYRTLVDSGVVSKAKLKPRSKYGNKPEVRDGVRYDSKAELRYKDLLDLRVKVGDIAGYDYHVKIPLIAGDGVLLGYYEADFILYMPDGTRILTDVKAPATINPLFRWKAKHVQAQYGETVVLIDSKTLKPIV